MRHLSPEKSAGVMSDADCAAVREDSPLAAAAAAIIVAAIKRL
jgi:hypothetical protein